MEIEQLTDELEPNERAELLNEMCMLATTDEQKEFLAMFMNRLQAENQ